jgi:hypothetical protein
MDWVDLPKAPQDTLEAAKQFGSTRAQLEAGPPTWTEVYAPALGDQSVGLTAPFAVLDEPAVAYLLLFRCGAVVGRLRSVPGPNVPALRERLLVDCAVISYYHTLRINGWVGNAAALIEGAFFGTTGPSARFQDRYGRGSHRIHGLRIEDHVQRIGEQLLPLLDRCNRMLIRNLKALRALREGPAPSVSIGAAAQVDVGGVQQVNGDVSRDGRDL